MKKRTGDDWFPFWIDKWLLGSTRDELTVEQCAVWVDFLALSYKDDGFIRANEGMPYPIKRLAGLLNRTEKLIQSTIDRCLEPGINKLRLEPDGTLYVISHPAYELSKRQKRRIDAEHKIEFCFETKKWRNISAADISGWEEAYPACDVNAELLKMREWLLANPSKKKSNYRRFITNWLTRQQDSGGTTRTRSEKTRDEIQRWIEKDKDMAAKTDTMSKKEDPKSRVEKSREEKKREDKE